MHFCTASSCSVDIVFLARLQLTNRDESVSDTFIAGWAVVVGWCYIMAAHVAGMSGNPVSCQPAATLPHCCLPPCLPAYKWAH